MTDSVATLRLLAKCGSMDLSALGPIADEMERLQSALKSVYKLAGGHAIECQCRQCEIFELLEPIVGNASPRSAPEPYFPPGARRVTLEEARKLYPPSEPIEQRSTYTNLKFRNASTLPPCDACGQQYSEHDPIGFYCPTKKSNEVQK